jgi:hypothetical protein
MMHLYEGGNIFGDGDIPKEYVRGVVDRVQLDLPSGIKAIPDIGSAGYKVASGDMDLFIDAEPLMKKFNVADDKKAKEALAQFMAAKGYPTKISGRNVHIEVPYKTTAGTHKVQVDLMVIADAPVVAPWHQHGPRGMYDQPGFKGAHNFMLMSSIAKYLGLKFDPFAAKLSNRETGEVVGRTRKQVAKILLGPKAKETDLDSVASMMKALASDPDREGKLAQARQDQAKGLITLENDVAPGTSTWFKQMSERLK